MLPPLSCLVMDDEPPACKLLERFIGRVDSLRWIGTCTNAISALDYDVTDYLLKPIAFDRFLRAINKVHSRRALAAPEETVSKPSLPETPPVSSVTSANSALWIKVNKQQIRLPVDEIVFVESMKDYTHFNLTNKSLRVHQPLSAIEELLTDEFLRISRSFIVRCSAITAIRANAVELITKQQLPIGITYRELVRERLRQYRGLV